MTCVSLLLHVFVLDVSASCPANMLQQLGWQHHLLLNTGQLVVCIDVNDGMRSSGINIAVSRMKMETHLEFNDSGLHMICILFSFYVIIAE